MNTTQIRYSPFQSRSSFFPSRPTGAACCAPSQSFGMGPRDGVNISPIAQMLMLFGGGSLLGSMVGGCQQMSPVATRANFGQRAAAPTGAQTGGDLSRLGPDRYDNIIREAAAKYNLDPALIKAVIKKESSFNPRAGSSAGAQGLMQLMPGTFRAMGGRNPLDPRDNIFAGAKYLSQMLRQQNGNLELALAAYNAGPGNVRKHGGIPPFRETRNYVQVVTSDYRASQG